MAMVLLTRNRKSSIAWEVVKKLKGQSPTPELIEEIGNDLAELYPDQFGWYIYTNDKQVRAILDEILELEG